MGAKRKNVGEVEADDLFRVGEAAVTVSGYWIKAAPENISEVVNRNMRVALLPGVPFIGGGHFIIWKNSVKAEAAIRLLKHLYSDERNEVLRTIYGLPANEAGWARPPFNLEENQPFKVSIQKGRTFSNAPLWGLVEKRLTDLFPVIWEKVLETPELSGEIVENEVKNLARRLRMTLQSS